MRGWRYRILLFMSKEFEIKNVVVHSWTPPGNEWWDFVESKPTEPLIDATIRVVLSYGEYVQLLRKDREE